MAEPTEMPFGLWTRVDERKHVLDGCPDPPCEWEIFTGKDIMGHVRPHTAVSCAKMAERI